MIRDSIEWARAFLALAKRFGRTPDTEEARMYGAYLDSCGLTVDEAVAACRSLWATARFWPRPADFLEVTAEREWAKVLYLSQRHGSDPEYRAVWDTLTLDAKDAIGSLGGIHTLKEARSILRVREAFFDALSRTTAARAAQMALGATSEPQMLPGGAETEDADE